MRKFSLLGILLAVILLCGWQSNAWQVDDRVSVLSLSDQKTLTSVATPDVSSSSFLATASPAVTIDDFTAGDLQEGRIIYVYSSDNATYDVTASGILGGTTDIVTATGDITTLIYDGTDWLVTSRIDASDDLN